MIPRISILDFGAVSPGQTPSETLRALVCSAPLLEALGYEALWVAEHHEKYFSHSAPEVVLTAAASITKRIRIGPAGALMHFHSPLRVAETYRAMAALFPGRVDLGLASGLTGDAQIRTALSPGFNLQEAMETRLYGQRVDELMSYLRNEVTFNDGKQYAGPPPIDQPCPPVVMLGSGNGRGNMLLAAKHGAAFCYSLAHSPTPNGRQIMAEYRETFQPNAQCKTPRTMIAASCLCAEKTVEAYATLGTLGSQSPAGRVNIIGNPNDCLDRILGLLAKYECEEIVLFPMYNQVEARAASYRMLAEVCGLSPMESNCEPILEPEASLG